MNALSRLLGLRAPAERKEPSLVAPKTRSANSYWPDIGWSAPTASGVEVNMATAMQVTTVMACVNILSNDTAKLVPSVFKRNDNGSRTLAKSHILYNLLYRPAPWLTWYEFCTMLMIGLLLRGNGYAVILRNQRGDPTTLVPINPDRVQLWESPSGDIFYRVSRSGLHEMAVLKNQPLLIPADDMFHLRGPSANGILGLSAISMARETIGLAIGQERLAAGWTGNGAQPRGILTTDAKLGKEAAERMANDWRQLQSGLNNAGKTAVFEQGLKWQPLSMSSQDMEFLASRQFQLQEIARIFRVPPHMLGDMGRATHSNITQQSQDYLNMTLSTYTQIWEEKLDFTFELRAADLFVDFDETRVLKADFTARYQGYRLGLQGFLTTNEVRIAEGLDPVKDGDTVYRPTNMAPLGSDVFQGTTDELTAPIMPGLGSDQSGEPAEGGGDPSAPTD